MVSLYRNPKGEGVFGPASTNNAGNTVILNGPEVVHELKKRIACLEDTVKNLQVGYHS